MELNKFFENLSNGAKWDVGVGINRTNKLPLDSSSVFSSKTAAENYAKGIVAEGQTDNAYPGMILSVVEETETVIYYIDANMTLQPVGNTKDVMAYIGSIPEGADATTIVEYINKKTEGIATDAALAELQTALNNILAIVVGTEDTEGLVDKVEANTEAIAAEKLARETAIGKAAEGDNGATGVYAAIAEALEAAKTYADDQDADTVYDDTALVKRVKAIEDDYLKKEDKYNDSEVRGLIADLDEAIGDANGGLVKDIAGNKTAIEAEVSRATAKEAELAQAIAKIDFVDEDELAEAVQDAKDYTDTEIDKVTEAISKLNHFTTKVVTSLDDVTETGILYLIKDENVTGVDKYNEYIVIDGAAVLIGDTTTDLSDYYNKEDAEQMVDNKLSSVQADLAEEVEAREMLAERVVVLEQTDKATQEELDAYKQEVTQTINTINGDLAKKVNTSDFNIFKTENTAAISSAVDAAKTEVTTAVADTYATKGELEAVNTTANNAATKTYVDTQLKNKANADIVYTKSEIDLKIGTPGTPEVKDAQGNVTTAAVAGTGVFASTYSKEELNALLDEIEGGSTESAASVARQLDAYKSSNDERVAKIEAKDTAQDTAIAAAQTQADLGVTNAAAAQSTANEAKTLLAALETNKVDKNATDIAALQGQITGENGLSARIGALEATDTQHATEFANLQSIVNTAVNTTIPAISGNVSKNATAITQIKTVLDGTPAIGEEGAEGYIPAVPGLVAIVDKKADAADVYTKTQVDAKLITSGEVVHGTTDSVAIADNKITVTVNSYTKGEVDTLLANLDQTELENGIAANAADIAALVGTDKDAQGKIKSVRTIAKEEVALVVGAAPDALNTLEEVANWIANDQSGAAAMANDIAANKAILAGFGTGEGQTATVLAAIEAAKQEAIAAIPALEVATTEKLGGVKSVAAILDEDGKITNAAAIENKVAVAADGSMEVNSLNVNKLTQTAGDVFVLDGGSAAN